MTTRATERVAITGLAPTYNAAAAGDKFHPGDHTFLHIKNGSGGSVTATITTPGTVGGNAVADPGLTVAAGADEMFGPFPRSVYAGSDGLAAIAWSATASVTWAVVEVG